jgi:geranylgeranyl diphosphate synthase type I
VVTTVPLLDEEDVRADVDRALAAALDALGSELETLGIDAQLAGELRGFVAGGKRLRAALCYWSWRAHGGRTADDDARRTVLRVGAALELFQAAALVHDDVMDASDTRRGRPAAHRYFASLHRSQGWSGPPDQFGNAAAIVLGDLALIASDRVFAAALHDAPAAPGAAGPAYGHARAVFDAMRTEVTAGQYLDLRAQALPWVAPEEEERRARAVVVSKSARYSVEHPLTLGAALAGAGPDALDLCREVGLPLGEAFQLRDDVLGIFGDPSVTGKPTGDDLREGKRTVLIARALAAADDTQRDRLTGALGRRDLSDDDVAELRRLLRDTGAVAAVERLIDDLAGPALATLRTAELAEPGRTMLVRLGHASVDRHA